MDGLDLRICHWLLDICSHSVRRCHNSCGHSLPFQTHIQITQHGMWTTLSLMMGLLGLCFHSVGRCLFFCWWCVSDFLACVPIWVVLSFTLVSQSSVSGTHTYKIKLSLYRVFFYGKFVLGEFIAPSNISPSGSLLTFQRQNNETFGSLDNFSAF